MDAFGSQIHQVLVKLLDGKHRILNFDEPSITVPALKVRIETLTSIPSRLQLLLTGNSRVLHDCQTLTLSQSCENSRFPNRSDSDAQLDRDRYFTRFRFADLAENPGPCQRLEKFPVVVHLLLRLRGGKGGFGSLLRGAATKAGQKKTNNFDACRDMSGRRLRHVNAEKKLEEWKAEADERKLEKMAEDFLKKKAKETVKSGKANGGEGAEKYVAKYRKDSAKCMEEVDKSVRESVKAFMSSKRKNQTQGDESASKRLKIWFGKRKFGGSDSEEEDNDDSSGEEENEKSVIIDHGSHSDSSKDADASSGSVTGGKCLPGSVDKCSPASQSDEDTVAEESLTSHRSLDECGKANHENFALESLEENRDQKIVVEVADKPHTTEVGEIVSLQPVTPGSEVRNDDVAEADQKESVSVGANLQDMNKPLNFDECNSAAELEVLGLERLKLELQTGGLKCGGSLQERAARLFLLKTTPLEKIPRKLFAKK